MTQSVKYGPNFPVSLFIFSENIKDKCKNIEKNAKIFLEKICKHLKKHQPTPRVRSENVVYDPLQKMTKKFRKSPII